MNSEFFSAVFSLTFISSAQAAPKHQNDDYTVLIAACLQQRDSQTASILFTKEGTPEEYDHLNYQWNSRHGNIQPMAILTPNSNADVSNAIICAKELGIHVVAKSGGHSYEKYSSGDNETLIVDMINFKQIDVETKTKTLVVGTGVLLSHKYAAIWNAGQLGLAAGSCVGVGAAHTLGAGYGVLSKRFGMTLDNVLQLEFVAANGDVRIANSETNQDLFWALRGAGAGNFGIVTKLKYQLFDAKDMIFTYITLVYPDVSQFSEVFKAWDAFNAADINGTTYTQFAAWPWHLSISILDVNLTESDIKELKSHFPPATTATVKSMNFIELIVDGSWPHVEADELPIVKRQDQPKSAFKAKSYFSSKTLSDLEVLIVSDPLTRIPNGAYVYFSSYGGAINRVPSNATAFVHRNSLYNIQMAMDWRGEMQSWAQDVDDAFMTVLDNGESYQNYNDGTLRNYLERYYGGNLPRLIQIKRNVDPTNFFRFKQSIPVVWNGEE